MFEVITFILTFIAAIAFFILWLRDSRRTRKLAEIASGLKRDKKGIKGGVADARIILTALVNKQGKLTNIDSAISRANSALRALDRVWPRFTTPGEEKLCNRCGNVLKKDSVFCRKCGFQLRKT